jgi:acetyl-CoA synthetase
MEKLTPGSHREFRETFKLTVPDRYNFSYDTLDAIAERSPDSPAMLHVDHHDVARVYDFGFFKRESDRLAAGLMARGVTQGDRIMIILYRRVEFWITMLALHKIGALPVPSPNLLTSHDIEFRVNYAKIKGVICEDSIVSRVEGVRKICPTLKHFVQAGEAPLPEGWVNFDTLCSEAPHFVKPNPAPGGKDQMVIFFSSGTTGMPKMVLHDFNYPLGHYVTAVYWHNLSKGDLHLTLADSGWAKSVWGKFYGQWMAEAVIFVWDFRGKFDPAKLLEIIAQHKVNSFCAPPTVYRFMIQQDLAKYDLSHLKHCTTAGELLNASIFEAWQKATGKPIYEGYGQTETCLQVATLPFMKPKPGSIGRPTPGWKLVLFNEEGKPCAAGEEGEIRIDLRDGPPVGLFQGYLDEPKKTGAVMHDGWYHTGDKAWVDEDGYYWFLGRNDDLIKSSGYRIGPFEVESALITHPAVVEAAVTGVPDSVRGQAVKATVVLAKGFQGSDELTKELQNHVKTVTAPYKYPRIIEYAEELPKTISGKIKRAEIRARDRVREQ